MSDYTAKPEHTSTLVDLLWHDWMWQPTRQRSFHPNGHE